MKCRDQELLPCPFCGADAFTSWDGDTDSPNDWSVNCDNTLPCGATVQGMSSEADAIKAWNTRTTLPEAPAPKRTASISKPPRRKSKKEQIADELRESDLTALETDRRDIEYGHHDSLPRGEHVARIKRG